VIAASVAVLSIFPVESRHMHTWGFTLLYVAFGFLVAKAVAFDGSRAIRVVSSLLARIGVYSYSIYLWQVFFAWKVLPHFHIAILFGIAAAKIIEMPALHFRDRVFPAVSRPLTKPDLAKAI
jgi:peptidoglycan/LPS O-acetylase OafA/YrhL